jgi:hypothetical protein
MAARQRETTHELDDGFVVAWDSSDVDEQLRENLVELASEQIGGIAIAIGGKRRSEAATPEPSESPNRLRIAA